MNRRKPTIALIYDFDGTLSPLNMQEYDFLNAIGIKDKAKFWEENQQLIEQHDASNILSYMWLMLSKSREASVSIHREAFVEYGRSVELYPGVKEWFGIINRLGAENDVNIEHYINSSGLQEMIEGTEIAHEFKHIFACRFMYDEQGVAFWPAVAVDFTAKTQFLFMINKGIESISENRKINEYTPDSERPIPFDHFIYFGDGETDVPCMKLVKQKGGYSIAVYKPRSPKRSIAEKLVHDDRVSFASPADYTEGGKIYDIVKTIIRKIKFDYDFMMEQERNLKGFERK